MTFAQLFQTQKCTQVCAQVQEVLKEGQEFEHRRLRQGRIWRGRRYKIRWFSHKNLKLPPPSKKRGTALSLSADPESAPLRLQSASDARAG